MQLGWCPGTLSVAGTLAAYPGTEAVRVFRNLSQTLPSWTGTILAPIVAADATVHLSFKVWDLAAVYSWLTSMPAGVRLVLTYAHEPEQQTGGDPTPEVFRSRWAELVSTLAPHPKRSQVILAPVYTHYWWERNRGDLRYWPGEAAYGLDAIGWDIYNESSSSYRDPANMLSLCREFSAQMGKPYLLGEWGAERVTGDPAGTGCADWMRAFVNVARTDGAVTATWFHFGGDDLIATGRTVEEDTLADLIAQEATDPPPPPSGIGFVQAGTKLNATTSPNLEVPAPAGVTDGDYLLALMGWIGTTVTVTDPAGFPAVSTLLGAQTDGSNITSRTYRKVAGSEGPTYQWGLSSGRKAVGWVGAYRGVHPVTPLADWASAASLDGTAHTAPAVDVPEGGWLVTMVVSRHANTGAPTTWSVTGGDAKRWEAASNAAGSQDITVAVFDSGTPLPSGTYSRTVTASQAQTEITVWSVVLAPADVAPPAASTDLIPGVPLS